MSQDSSSDSYDRLQELLKIKRLEQPESGFSERFLKDFQFRQRSEVMRRSSFQLFWDRFETLLGGSVRSRYALAGAATALFVVVGISFGELGQKPEGYTELKQAPSIQSRPQAVPVNMETQRSSDEVQMKEVDLRIPENSGRHFEF